MASLTNNTQADGSSGKIRVAIQRVNSAKLLIDNNKKYCSMNNGLIVYISFTSDCTLETIPKAASQIANLPVVTLGNWGDGSKPRSIRDFVQSGESIGMMIIPQAGMVSKIKGKTLQYRRQASKADGMKLYKSFCSLVVKAVVDTEENQSNAGGNGNNNNSKRIPPNVLPSELFIQYYKEKYSEFDDDGIPTKTFDGDPIAKSQRKKLLKKKQAQEKKYKRYIANPDQFAKEIAETLHVSEETPESKEEVTDQKKDFTLPSNFTFIQGTFGNRQGLQLNAECGPFTHSFTFS
jgi:D-Tyr-tRNAtyr deacylase